MLGNIASIATLILFAIYFIGRIISLIIEKKVIYEKIDIYIEEDDISGIPLYMIEFERSDFIKGTLVLQSNGKNGIQEEIKCKFFTLKWIVNFFTTYNQLYTSTNPFL